MCMCVPILWWVTIYHHQTHYQTNQPRAILVRYCFVTHGKYLLFDITNYFFHIR